jgi:hypothetical protein
VARGSPRDMADPGLLYGPRFKRPRRPRVQRSEEADGTIVWRAQDKFHREDGPALRDPRGRLEWWRHGLRHREDGAAVECEDGRREWWLEGEQVSLAQWSKATGRGLGEPRSHDFLAHGGCLRCGVKLEEGGRGAIGCEVGIEGNDPDYVGLARTALEQDLQITLKEKMEGIVGEADDLSVREFHERAEQWNEQVVSRAISAAALPGSLT